MAALDFKRVIAIDTAFVDSDHRSTYEIGFAALDLVNNPKLDKGKFSNRQFYITPSTDYSFERKLLGRSVKASGNRLFIDGAVQTTHQTAKIIEFIKKLGEKVDFFCAHNAHVDYNRLKKLSQHNGIEWPDKPWINTLTLFRYLNDQRKGNLAKVKRHYDVQLEKNSANDAVGCLLIIADALQRNPSLIPVCTHATSALDPASSGLDFERIGMQMKLYETLTGYIDTEGERQKIDALLKRAGIPVTFSDGISPEEMRHITLNLAQVNRIILSCLEAKDVIRILIDHGYKPGGGLHLNQIKAELLEMYCSSPPASASNAADPGKINLSEIAEYLHIDALKTIVKRYDESNVVDYRSRKAMASFMNTKRSQIVPNLDSLLTKDALVLIATEIGIPSVKGKSKGDLAAEIRKFIR